MYAELHALSNFSFLKAASHPEELVTRAAELGYCALAVTDECSMAGVVRAHVAAKEKGLKLLIGSELRCMDGLTVVVLVESRRGYAALCRLISKARRRAIKGSYELHREDLVDALPECMLIWLPGLDPSVSDASWLRSFFTDRLWVGVTLHRHGDDSGRLHSLMALAQELSLPCVASGGVLMHVAERKPLHDVLTAIRLGRPVQDCGYALLPNAEYHLRTLPVLEHLYPPTLLQQTLVIAERCRFTLDELRYEYPRELVPTGHTPSSWLQELTYAGAAQHWPEGIPDKVVNLLKRELALIAELGYESFFLTVEDLVREARHRNILCQGRGSAANSAVCYCLGVTAVDPSRQEVLFERFLSRERAEPPDIDVDFEHERREEIIQYIYEKYGRHRAGIAATVIAYRLRSALRDVGKAFGLDVLQIERLLKSFERRGQGSQQEVDGWVREAGFDPRNPLIVNLLQRMNELRGFPRHLSQHVGGFVIAATCLEELVPIENAGMEDRTIIQWDKDDLESLGLLKVDVLALGMLTAIRKALALHNDSQHTQLTLDSIPKEDPAVYEMISKANTIGVFQIESRAQMTMLPRLRPKEFYDLVIEVAIVRPGPIQGDMVHPYLRRRSGLEAITYPSDAVEHVLKRTYGVPIFQEQVMQLAIVAAGFTPGEADQLRRAMAAWKKSGNLKPFRDKLLAGLAANGYATEFGERLFRQIEGFGEYGFPESHAASFALLAYVSAWLKCHTPAAFTAALINSQPMGFYPPAQLVRDAREHGVEIRPVDVRYSEWDCILEARANDQPGLRLGFRLVKGLSAAGGARIAQARHLQVFTSAQDMQRRARLSTKDMEALAAADALSGLAGNRHHAAWTIAGIDMQLPLFADVAMSEALPLLPTPTEAQNIQADYVTTSLTLRRHPMALLRERFLRRKVVTVQQLQTLVTQSNVRVAGLVLARQSPQTAHNTTFMTLEDETGTVNVVVWQKVSRHYREAFLQARLLEVHGRLQSENGVTHVVAKELVDRSAWVGALQVDARNFH